ncbi:MAG TPA: hypothetical protein VFB50_22485 [Chloroflexota bacterium]|nr:hypothetical protein [Chloroflexota bacterium]
MERGIALPRWANVRVTLGDRTTRTGHVLVDYGDRVLVEYTTPAGFFAARKFLRSAVELLETTLCGTHGSRNRVCAAAAGHVGDHTFVIRSGRED